MWILIVFSLTLPINYSATAYSFEQASDCTSIATDRNVQLQSQNSSYRLACYPTGQVLTPNPDYRPGSLPEIKL